MRTSGWRQITERAELRSVRRDPIGKLILVLEFFFEPVKLLLQNLERLGVRRVGKDVVQFVRIFSQIKQFPLVDHPPLAKSEGAIVSQPVQSVAVEIGWQGPSIGKDDAATYAADVFSFILRQPDSRFQRALVGSQLANGAGFGYYTQRNVGPIQAQLATSPEKAKAAICGFT